MHGADSAGIRVCRPGPVDVGLERCRHGAIRRRIGPRPPGRRHRARAKFADHALPDLRIGARLRCVERVERESGGAKSLVVTGDAVLIEQGLGSRGGSRPPLGLFSRGLNDGDGRAPRDEQEREDRGASHPSSGLGTPDDCDIVPQSRVQRKARSGPFGGAVPIGQIERQVRSSATFAETGSGRHAARRTARRRGKTRLRDAGCDPARSVTWPAFSPTTCFSRLSPATRRSQGSLPQHVSRYPFEWVALRLDPTLACRRARSERRACERRDTRAAV